MSHGSLDVHAGHGRTGFELLEATISSIHRAYRQGELRAQDLVTLYLERIEAYDRHGPSLRSVITVHPEALRRARELDRQWERSGAMGPLHGIPVLLKDQIDVKGTPTTLGSKLLRDYFPERDAFVVTQLQAAGAIVLAKASLGELGGGDTHGTLFGSTRNPYALDRTPGGSSGGCAAGVAANFATAAVGQEGIASIRRPAAWNSIVGMRPSLGLVSRGGVYAGWPSVAGSLGPMARTVEDAARLLEVMVGYDAEDPTTALGIGHLDPSLARHLNAGALEGMRIGVLREPMGLRSEPDHDDYGRVSLAFDQSVEELAHAGAHLVDPIVIEDLRTLLDARGNGTRGGAEAAFQEYFRRSAHAPYTSLQDLLGVPGYVPAGVRRQVRPERSVAHLLAREQLFYNFMKVMADHRLDVIVHRTVEHEPTFIRDGVGPPYVNMKGATHLNTFLSTIPAISVPGPITGNRLPSGITFLARPFADGTVLSAAYGYEQATRHRWPPPTTPPLTTAPGDPRQSAEPADSSEGRPFTST